VGKWGFEGSSRRFSEEFRIWPEYVCGVSRKGGTNGDARLFIRQQLQFAKRVRGSSRVKTERKLKVII